MSDLKQKQEKLSKEKQIIELLKCKNDPVYFINNYVYIEEPGGLAPFSTYPKQDEFVRLFQNHHYVITLKSRQIGISTITRALCAWAMTFYSGIVIGIVSRDGPESTDFARKTRRIIEDLPKWMRPAFNKKTEQTFILKNGSELYASAVNQSNPSGIFRGKTLTILVIDEAAFIPKIKQAYTGIAPATLRAHQVASEKGIPYGILVISTPNGTKDHPIGGWYYEMWQQALEGKNGFKPIRIHYKDAPFTDKEWETKARQIVTTELDWQQEMELKFIAGKDGLLEPETAVELQNYISKPIETIDRVYFDLRGNKLGTGQWRFYSYPNTGKYYICGIDIAGGYIGSCNSAIQIIDADTLQQVAEFEGKLRVNDLLKEVKFIVDKFHKQLLIAPEMNSVGIKFVEDLEEDDQLRELLYYTRIYDDRGRIKKLIPGISTNTKTRPKMIDALYWTIKEDPTRLRSEKTINQILSLDSNLRGGLSDLTMALAIAYYVAREDHEYVKEKKVVIKDHHSKEFYDNLFILQDGEVKDINEIRRINQLKKQEDDNDQGSFLHLWSSS